MVHQALTPLEPGDPRKMGSYQLVARLGAGGMGAVYLGRSSEGQQVAVKVIRPELSDDPSFRERFRREALAAARIAGVCTARVHCADLDGSRPYLVTDFIKGPTLHGYVETQGPITDRALLRALAVGLLEALVAIHAASIVHRDLKPGNVILAADGPKVVDFGIAHALELTSITHAGTIVGSPAWMAPEQLETSDVTAAADVFAWASTMHFAATGSPPFGVGRPEVILYRIAHTSPDLRPIPDFLRGPMAIAFSKDPKVRPTASALLSALAPDETSALSSPSSIATAVLAETWRVEDREAPGAGQQTIAPAPSRRGPPLVAFGAVGIVLVFIAVVAWGLRSRSGDSNAGAVPSTAVPSTAVPATDVTTATVSPTLSVSTTAPPIATTTLRPAPLDSGSALAEVAARYPKSTRSAIVPQADGDLVAIGYGQGAVIYRYVDGEWVLRGTVTFSEAVDTDVPIDVADVTFDGQPDFLIHLQTGNSKGGSVVSAHSRAWKVVPFLNDSGVAEPWRTGATITSGRLLTYAVGSRAAEPWLYSAQGGYLYRNLGPGRGGVGE